MGGARAVRRRVRRLGTLPQAPSDRGARLAPTDTDARSVAFLAWFGPLGVAAIYYATYVERFAVADGEKIFAAAILAIFVSVLVHSITATPAVRMYAGRSPLRTLRRPLDPASETDP